MNPEQTAYMVPRDLPVPRGALWAAGLAALALQGLHRLAAQLSLALQATLLAAARAVLNSFSSSTCPAAQPKPAATPEQRTLEAAEVRELTFSYLKIDPGFAGDLLAAADRHERGDSA